MLLLPPYSNLPIIDFCKGFSFYYCLRKQITCGADYSANNYTACDATRPKCCYSNSHCCNSSNSTSLLSSSPAARPPRMAAAAQ